MARVTVEDCIENIPNRFKLVLVASNRAKKLSKGVKPTLDRDNDKNPVLALREIASSLTMAEELQASYIVGLQRVVIASEVIEEEEKDLEMEKDWSEQIAQLSRELESLGSIEESLDGMQVEDSDSSSDFNAEFSDEDDEFELEIPLEDDEDN